MKIVSWNVNGIRSSETQFLEYVSSDQPDILMIQELRAHPDQLSFFLKMIPGYEAVFNPSDRPGYSGTAIYYKTDLGVEVIIEKEHPVLSAEGRAMKCVKDNLVVFNFYTPNGTSNEKRLKIKLKFYEEIKKEVKKLVKKGKDVIIGGDLNVAHTEIDLYAPQRNQRHSGFLPEERKWFDDLLGLGFTDTLRMFEKGSGHYTWWHLRDPKREQNNGWRFDYFLVSEKLKGRVEKAEIQRDVFGSDHCPIVLELKV